MASSGAVGCAEKGSSHRSILERGSTRDAMGQTMRQSLLSFGARFLRQHELAP